MWPVFSAISTITTGTMRKIGRMVKCGAGELREPDPGRRLHRGEADLALSPADQVAEGHPDQDRQPADEATEQDRDEDDPAQGRERGPGLLVKVRERTRGEVEPDEGDDGTGDHGRHEPLDEGGAPLVDDQADDEEDGAGHEDAGQGRGDAALLLGDEDRGDEGEAASQVARQAEALSASDRDERKIKVPMPEKKMVVFGGKPISTGTMNVAPNIASTCWKPETDGLGPGEALVRRDHLRRGNVFSVAVNLP